MTPTPETMIANALIDAGINEKISVQEAKAFLALLPAATDGWTLVPKLATADMIKAGCTWSGLPAQTWTDMIDAAPASPAPLPVAVKVKPLGWVSIGEVIFASTPFGSYEIRPNRTSSTTYPLELVVPGEKTATRFFYFEDKAKAATQADYETRIRSALCSPVGGAAQCCMCGKKGLSTVEGDGGSECELSDGRWVCSAECWDKAVSPTSDIAALREENDPLFWMRLGARAMRLSARAACGNHWESSQEDAMTSGGLSKLAKEKLYAEANASEEISRVISDKCEDSALGYASYMGDEADRKLLADQGVTSDWLYRHHTGEPSRKELSDRSALSQQEQRMKKNQDRCPRCGAGPLGNCGYYGCETARETCPLKRSAAPLDKGGE